MDVFDLHRNLIDDYASYTRSSIRIQDQRVRETVEGEIRQGLLWPDPLLQLNPSFETGATIPELVDEGLLHEECGRICRVKRYDTDFGNPHPALLQTTKATTAPRPNGTQPTGHRTCISREPRQ